jgi:hypothetical protein
MRILNAVHQSGFQGQLIAQPLILPLDRPARLALYGDIPAPRPNKLETISAEIVFHTRCHVPENLFLGLTCQVSRPVPV